MYISNAGFDDCSLRLEFFDFLVRLSKLQGLSLKLHGFESNFIHDLVSQGKINVEFVKMGIDRRLKLSVVSLDALARLLKVLLLCLKRPGETINRSIYYLSVLLCNSLKRI